MPDINCGGQIFDLAFHPTHQTVYTGLLTGHIKSFTYDDQGNYQSSFALRPTKRSCRGLALSPGGDTLWSVGKGKALHSIDTITGQVSESRKDAHGSTINRVKHIMSHMLATGDDDGVIKLWDPRQPSSIRSYTHHFDFISDFLWLEDKKHLVATSGDGTLSVMDVRSKKTEPFAQSEDQEDELLSLVSIKGGSKVVVGTQLGILSIFNNKSKGWSDCVDRVPGHPSSIDALCPLPSAYPNSSTTILTGSSDGLLRAVQLLPTKLIGIVVDHGTFPIERIEVDRGGEGRWVGSVGHEDVLRLTDLKEVFEDGEREGEDKEAMGDESEVEQGDDEQVAEEEEKEKEVVKSESESEESDAPKEKKRKRKKDKEALSGRTKKGKNQVDAEPSFFSGL